MSNISNKCDDFELPLFVGTDENTQDLFMDFACVRRLLIIGDSGEGKSTLASNMILSLMQQLSPEQCQIALIDTRLLEFPLLENAKHIHSKAFSVEDALDCLQHLDEIIRERYRILAKAECARISDYNAKSKEKLPYIVCFIDEIADMLVNYPDKATELLQRVCNGGPVGVFLIAATKELMPEVFSAEIRLLFKNFITFEISEAKCDVDYIKVYLDGIEPWNLKKLGQHVLKMEYDEPMVLQGKLITDEEIEQKIASLSGK